MGSYFEPPESSNSQMAGDKWVSLVAEDCGSAREGGSLGPEKLVFHVSGKVFFLVGWIRTLKI